MTRRALLIVAYVAFLLALLEGVARLLIDPEALCRPFLCQDSASWRLWWAARHRPGEEILYRFDVHDPTRGWALRPNLDRLSAFGGKILSSNSQGFRGAREYPREKPPGRTRIVALGDSFTFGEEVSDHETYSSVLAQSLPGTEVLNLGVHGYGHDQMLLYLREVGLDYRPDIVLLGFVREDMNRNLLSFRDFAKPRFEVDGERLVLEGFPVPSPESVLAREPWQSKLLDLFAVLHQSWRWRSGANERDAERVTDAILGAMIEEARTAGAEPVLVYLPVGEELRDPSPSPLPGEAFLEAACQKRRVRCLSLRTALVRADRRGDRLLIGWHWAPRAHAIAAHEIARFLRASGLVR